MNPPNLTCLSEVWFCFSHRIQCYNEDDRHKSCRMAICLKLISGRHDTVRFSLVLNSVFFDQLHNVPSIYISILLI